MVIQYMPVDVFWVIIYRAMVFVNFKRLVAQETRRKQFSTDCQVEVAFLDVTKTNKKRSMGQQPTDP